MKKLFQKLFINAIILGLIWPASTSFAESISSTNGEFEDLVMNTIAGNEIDNRDTSSIELSNKVNFDGGIIFQNKVLVPMRDIFNELGAEVNWNESTQSINANKGGHEIRIQINSKTAIVNGNQIALDVPAKMINDRTFVPVRVVSEGLSATVDWDNTARLATITTSDKVIYVTARLYFEINGVGFTYDGEIKNGLPNGSGVGIVGPSIYGEVYHDGQWENGKPVIAAAQNVSEGISPENLEALNIIQSRLQEINNNTSSNQSSYFSQESLEDMVDSGTVAVSMTKDQVLRAWGQPSQIIQSDYPGIEDWLYYRADGLINDVKFVEGTVMVQGVLNQYGRSLSMAEYNYLVGQ